jgi:hypothetical protein
MSNFIYYTLLFLFLLSCSSPSKKETEVLTENKSTIHKTIVYSGKIGKFPITMELNIDDESVIGRYEYNNKCEVIDLTGEFKNGNLTLSGSDEIFNGKMDSTLFSGTWTKGKKKLDFACKETITPFFTTSIKKLNNENCKYANENRKHITDSTNYWDTLCTTIDLELMSFSFEDKALEKKINQFIEKEVCGFGNMFEDVTKIKSIKQLMNTVNKVDEYGYEHSISCNFIERFENILTFSISDYSYGFGAAHPNHFSVMYNIDLKTGKLIQLEDIFKKGTKNQLNKIAEKLFIRENGSEGWDFEQGKFELNSDFIIQKDGLLFTFDAYEIGPYAAGDPFVFIPYTKIKKLLKNESVLKALIN